MGHGDSIAHMTTAIVLGAAGILLATSLLLSFGLVVAMRALHEHDYRLKVLEGDDVAEAIEDNPLTSMIHKDWWGA